MSAIGYMVLGIRGPECEHRGAAMLVRGKTSNKWGATCFTELNERVPLMRQYMPLVYGNADVPTAQAAALLELIRTHPQQRRASMTVHPLLMQVAQARAQDCADRDYFSHVDLNGYGPNWYVRQAGYVLPDWYGQHMAANNVESIHGGAIDATMVVDGWMHSESHSVHMLGLNSFYAEQTDIGAGYAKRYGTVYTHYWVFISAMQGG